jgi:hypothetical protein
MKCCGSGMFIPESKISIPGPGSDRQLRFLRVLLSSEKYDTRFSSRIQIFPIYDPDPGVEKAPDPGSATLTTCHVIKMKN